MVRETSRGGGCPADFPPRQPQESPTATGRASTATNPSRLPTPARESGADRSEEQGQRQSEDGASSVAGIKGVAVAMANSMWNKLRISCSKPESDEFDRTRSPPIKPAVTAAAASAAASDTSPINAGVRKPCIKKGDAQRQIAIDTLARRRSSVHWCLKPDMRYFETQSATGARASLKVSLADSDPSGAEAPSAPAFAPAAATDAAAAATVAATAVTTTTAAVPSAAAERIQDQRSHPNEIGGGGGRGIVAVAAALDVFGASSSVGQHYQLNQYQEHIQHQQHQQQQEEQPPSLPAPAQTPAAGASAGSLCDDPELQESDEDQSSLATGSVASSVSAMSSAVTGSSSGCDGTEGSEYSAGASSTNSFCPS